MHSFLFGCPFQVRLPFSSLRPIFRARTVLDAPPFDPSNMVSLQACFVFTIFTTFGLSVITIPLT